jgi:general secretion pathway protein G
MVEIIRRLILAGIAIGIIAGNGEEITEFYDETVAHARHIATAADLRAISNMLDYEFMKRGRYPRPEKFLDWMARTFKENDLQELGADHWGAPLVYETRDNHHAFTLVSRGPDGIAGTLDDLKITGP